MKTFQIQYLADNGNDGFMVVHSRTIEGAEADFKREYPHLFFIDIFIL